MTKLHGPCCCLTIVLLSQLRAKVLVDLSHCQFGHSGHLSSCKPLSFLTRQDVRHFLCLFLGQSMYDWLQRLFGDKSNKELANKDAADGAPAANTSVNRSAEASAQASQEIASKTPNSAPTSVAENTPSKPAAKPSTSSTVASQQSANLKPTAPHGISAIGSGASWEQRSDANANFNDWLFESNDRSELETTPVETAILEALDKIVKGKQSGADLVKRMPGVIPQLLQSLRTENFSGAELSRKIAHDVVLVAAVIRIANSSMYNPSQNITSIEHAVLILGQNGLRQLITGVAFRPIIDLHSGHYTKSIAPRIWDQSERCALACRMLALQDVDPFDAFLAGLIQNVGLVVALRIMDQTCQGKQEVGSAPFCSTLLRYTRSLSCSIAREWNFPETVSAAIEEQAGFNTAKMSTLGKILALGDYLAKVRILVGNDRLTEGDPRVLKGLSATALETYRELANVEVFDPLADSKA